MSESNFLEHLIEELEFHTLSIEILSKTAQVYRTKPETLLKAIKSNLQTDIKVQHRSRKIGKISNYLNSIFEFSELSEKEIWLLKNFTCLPIGPISLNRLRKLLGGGEGYEEIEDSIKEIEKKGKELLGIIPGTSTMDEMLRTLLGYDPKALISKIKLRDNNILSTLHELTEKGWINYNLTNDTYQIHKIIGDVVSATTQINRKDIVDLFEKTYVGLKVDQEIDIPTKCIEWIPFGLQITSIIEMSGDKDLYNLKGYLGMALNEIGELHLAKEHLTSVVYSFEETFGSNHIETSTKYSDLSIVLGNLEEYEEAKKLICRSITIDEKNYGTDHPTTSIRYSNYALLLMRTGENELAQKYLKLALSSDEKHLEDSNPMKGIRISNFGLVLRENGDFDNALKYFRKARLLYQIHSPEHPYLAHIYKLEAETYNSKKDYERARTYFLKSIKAYLTYYDHFPSQVWQCYIELIQLLFELKRFEELNDLAKEAQKTLDQSNQTNRLLQSIIYQYKGLYEVHLENYFEAIENMEKGLSVLREETSPEANRYKLSSENLIKVLKSKLS